MLTLVDNIGGDSNHEVYTTDDDRYVCKLFCRCDGYCLITTSFVREIASIRRLTGSQVVISYSHVAFETDGIRLLIPRYQSDLRCVINQQKTPFDRQFIKLVVFRILQGLYDASCQLIAHRDIKPENILINVGQGHDQSQVVICDWGISRYLFNHDPNYLTGEVQTIYYRCPEILLGQQQYSTHIDLWSVGLIMAEMYQRKIIFNGRTRKDQLDQIFRALGTPTLDDWPELAQLPGWRSDLDFGRYLPKSLMQIEDDPSAQDLLDRMLQLNPAKRINLTDAINHPYFDSIRSSRVDYPSTLTSLLHGIQAKPLPQFIGPDRTTRLKNLQTLFTIKCQWLYTHQTYFLALHYLDHYLSHVHVDPIKLLPLSLACLSLASKVNEIIELDSDRYIGELDLHGLQYTVDDLINLQIEIMKVMDYNLYCTTEYQFLKLFSSEFKLGRESIGLLYLASMDLDSRQLHCPLPQLALAIVRVTIHDLIDYHYLADETICAYLRHLLSDPGLTPIKQKIWAEMNIV